MHDGDLQLCEGGPKSSVVETSATSGTNEAEAEDEIMKVDAIIGVDIPAPHEHIRPPCWPGSSPGRNSRNNNNGDKDESSIV